MRLLVIVRFRTLSDPKRSRYACSQNHALAGLNSHPTLSKDVRGHYTSPMGAQNNLSAAAWSTRLIGELNTSDRHAKELISPLTAEQLNWQPGSGAWSIGQCIDHLCATNEVYVSAISAALTDKSLASVEEIAPGWFGRWFIRNYIEPSPESKHASAPKKIVPVARVDLSILNRFLSSNDAVREVVRRASDYDVNRIRFRNPFIPIIRFTAGTGLQIICSHQRRHLLQAERVKRSLDFPAVGR